MKKYLRKLCLFCLYNVHSWNTSLTRPVNVRKQIKLNSCYFTTTPGGQPVNQSAFAINCFHFTKFSCGSQNLPALVWTCLQ